MTTKIEKRHLVVNRLLLTYYFVGQKKKAKSVLFLHGWGADSTLWFKSILPLTQKGFSLYFLDLPGFGKSQRSPEPFSLQDYSYIVLEFIEKLDLGKVHLVGHSFGGKTAIKLAAENQEMLSFLVLVDSSGLPHKSLATDLKINIARLTKPFFAPAFMQPLKERLVRKFASDDYVAAPPLRQTFINVVNEDIKNELRLIHIPTLIVWGKNDENEYTPIDDAYHLNKAIKNSQLQIIDHAGHYCYLDQPEKFLNILERFLRQLS